eukprot:jgi/Botrbrau1/495/Bobra.110_2s0127.2
MVEPVNDSFEDERFVEVADTGREEPTETDDEGADGYKKGGYHPVKIGERYKQGQYVVLRKLGWGHFSTVWLVEEQGTGSHYALKVQKSASHYMEAAIDEIKLLDQIRGGDAKNEKCCVRLYDSFTHMGPHGKHMCMVFEVLGDNLLTLIKAYKYQGIPIPIVKRLTHQILVGLDYLHRELSIIHTDLKPENVMLTRPLEAPDSVSDPISSASGDLRTPLAVQNGQSLVNGQIPLTKNQKKKQKRKQKKAVYSAAEGISGDSARGSNDDDGADSSSTGLDTCTGDGALGSEFFQRQGSLSIESPPPHRLDQKCPMPAREMASREELTARLADANCKIVDFGNACWTYKQFTSDIQTRQYRCPEVILGAPYSTSADMWSLACMIFELVTGDLLFDPRRGKNFDRDEDHIALMLELLGKMPRKVALHGKFARELFNRNGELRHIKKLKYWSLDQVLVEKYDVPLEEAQALTEFMMPLLEYVPVKRATAQEMLRHPWLQDVSGYQPESRDGPLRKETRRERSPTDPDQVVKRSRHW